MGEGVHCHKTRFQGLFKKVPHTHSRLTVNVVRCGHKRDKQVPTTSMSTFSFACFLRKAKDWKRTAFLEAVQGRRNAGPNHFRGFEALVIHCPAQYRGHRATFRRVVFMAS